MSTYMQTIAASAKLASRGLASIGTSAKNAAITAIAKRIDENADAILAANADDLKKARENGMSDAMLDRLTLTEARLSGITADLRKVAELPDPVGTESGTRVLPNGLRLTKRRVPVGVIGVIYESRPNVTVDIAGLCLKTGNACILRGGSETINSNRALAASIKAGLEESGLSPDCVQFVDNTDRELVTEMLRMNEFVDMIIPRGGKRLSELCREKATVPVIVGGFGISHMFVDKTADLDRTVPVVMNAKAQRPSACNALDTLLLHEDIAEEFIVKLVEPAAAKRIRLIADERVLPMLTKAGYEYCEPATDESFDTEWLSLAMNVKVVASLDEVLSHMRLHNASHSDAIMTSDIKNAETFVNGVDSAAAYVNASTRFTDGGQFGLGAEVAISTQKLHARGPMGLEELTTYRWICSGDYLSRA